jgi:hypothetical protein
MSSGSFGKQDEGLFRAILCNPESTLNTRKKETGAGCNLATSAGP